MSANELGPIRIDSMEPMKPIGRRMVQSFWLSQSSSVGLVPTRAWTKSMKLSMFQKAPIGPEFMITSRGLA